MRTGSPGNDDLHLGRDPPADLVIEAENTHDADPSVEVWRRFGVPEVWVCDVNSLRILALRADGTYAEVEKSVAFPFLTAAEILEWVSHPQTGNETAWTKELRQWVRDVLVPRARLNREAEEPDPWPRRPCLPVRAIPTTGRRA